MNYKNLVLLSICCLFLPNTTAYASTLENSTINMNKSIIENQKEEFKLINKNKNLYQDKKGNIYIKLLYEYMPIEYSLNNISIERIELDNQINILIKDLNTNKTIEKLSEDIVKDDIIKNYRLIYTSKERIDGPAVSKLRVGLKVWGKGSFFEIEGVESKIWYPENSVFWTYKFTNVDVVPIGSIGNFPTNKVQISGDAIIENKKTLSASLGPKFSVKALKAAGFDVTFVGNGSRKYNARKHITLDWIYEQN